MSTHTTIRTAVATLVEANSLRVSQSSDAADMVATEQGAHVVAIAVDEAPGDDQGGVRMMIVGLSAARGRGCDEAAARAALATVGRTLRTAMLAPSALVSAEARVARADADTIARDGDVIVLRQSYTILAVV